MSSDDTDSFRRLGAAFATGGDRYQRLRPSYPDDAIDWLVEGVSAGAQVVDIGAGTGKLTVALVSRGFAVTAVDPSTDMLAQLRDQLPAVRVTVGTGEATTLAADSVDLVTFAQSWHWVEPSAGAAELQRVLAPGGRVGWVWNFLDVRVPWVAELSAIWHILSDRESIDATRHAPQLPVAFAPVETITVDWLHRTSPPDLTDLVTTRSYYLAASDVEQREIRVRAAALLTDSFPDADVIDLPYRTHCYRSRLAG